MISLIFLVFQENTLSIDFYIPSDTSEASEEEFTSSSQSAMEQDPILDVDKCNYVSATDNDFELFRKSVQVWVIPNSC